MPSRPSAPSSSLPSRGPFPAAVSAPPPPRRRGARQVSVLVTGLVSAALTLSGGVGTAHAAPVSAPVTAPVSAPVSASVSVPVSASVPVVSGGGATAGSDVATGVWWGPRYGVEVPSSAQVPAGLWWGPRYGVGVPSSAQVPSGLWWGPRYGVDVPSSAQVPSGLWWGPRYAVEASAAPALLGLDLLGATLPSGLWRGPRYGVDVPATSTTARPATSTTAPPATSTTARPATSTTARPATSTAVRLLGRKRSATPWYSGAWTGGYMSGARSEAFGRWRGTPLDSVTTYPDRSTWASMRNSRWHITTFASSPGRLVYGLPLLPERGGGTLADVAKGRYDAVYRQIARDLVSTGRGTTIVRIGFEANGTWHRYGGTARNAATFKAAYRRVARVMWATAPRLTLNFDITCGFAMPGSRSRLDTLTRLYPGDDVVDLVGCDMYDEWQTAARTPAQWRRAIRPARSVGIADVAAFARAHRKGMTIPEWGVAGRSRGGNGDNPFYITAMRGWMRANADVLVLENYFNDPVAHVRSDVWGGQNPRAAAAYRKAW